jgi:hypothetical protein
VSVSLSSIVSRLPVGRSRNMDSSASMGTKFLSSLQCSHQLCTQPSLVANGCGGVFPNVKLLRHEAAHSPPPSAEVKNELSYKYTPTFTFMVHPLVQQRYSLPFISNLDYL